MKRRDEKKEWNIYPHSFHSLNTDIPWLYKEDIQSNLDLDSVGASGWFPNPYSNLEVRFGTSSKHEKKGLFLNVWPVFFVLLAWSFCRLTGPREFCLRVLCTPCCTLRCFLWLLTGHHLQHCLPVASRSVHFWTMTGFPLFILELRFAHLWVDAEGQRLAWTHKVNLK